MLIIHMTNTKPESAPGVWLLERPMMLFISLGLILSGGLLAFSVQTNGLTVQVEDVRFTGPDDIVQNGRLFIPSGATPETPAPGIIAIHGYINTHETQGGFAIEFARRGFVVLAVDQTGHGYSDPPSGANGFGGPPALVYLRSLDFVDPDNIGLEGHSMGGWASLAAAAAMPDGYRSIVLEGSSVGTINASNEAPLTLRNVAVVFSRFDEFSGYMWGSPVPKNVVSSDRMKAFFGAENDVVPGRVYGSIEDGNARILHQPAVTHPGDHLSRVAIGHAVDWFQRTLDGGSNLSPSDQIWYWKELGTLIALIGMVLLLFPVGGMLLRTSLFAELAENPAPLRSASGKGWWLAALVFVVLPPLTLFPFKDLFGFLDLSANAVFPQNITTQVIVWTTLLGLLSLALFASWHLTLNRKTGATTDNYGLTWEGSISGNRVGKSLVLAGLVVLAGYLTLVMTAFLFKTDYRFWVFAVKPLDALHVRIAISYLIPFTGFFLVLGTLLRGQLRRDVSSLRKEMFGNVILLTVGFAGLLLYQYTPLLLGGTLAIPSEPLWTIITFQFLPIMSIIALVSTYFFRRTGHIYVGSFVSGLLVTWIVVASQATHYAF